MPRSRRPLGVFYVRDGAPPVTVQPLHRLAQVSNFPCQQNVHVGVLGKLLRIVNLAVGQGPVFSHKKTGPLKQPAGRTFSNGLL